MKRPRNNNNKQVKRKPCAWGQEPCPSPTYDFRRLSNYDPAFRKHVHISREDKSLSVDFTKREVTAALTAATLRQYFSLRFALPTGHLTPTVPNRVQYLRWVVSLLPVNAPARTHAVVDVGTGPSAIYALLGARLFPTWRFVGTDVDADALGVARGIVEDNGLDGRIKLVHTDPAAPLLDDAYWESFQGVPSATLCNPPFFDSVPETADSNGVAAGTNGQLSTFGGEVEFIKKMARDSVRHPDIGVFSSLVGLWADTFPIERYLRGPEIRAYQVAVRELKAGDKRVRYAVAWSFGPRSTRVTVPTGGTDALWRAAISASVGRKYANRMTKGEMIGHCCEAMRKIGWKEEGGGTRVAVEVMQPGCVEGAVKTAGVVEETGPPVCVQGAVSKPASAEPASSKTGSANSETTKPVGDGNSESSKPIGDADAEKSVSAGFVIDRQPSRNADAESSGAAGFVIDRQPSKNTDADSSVAAGFVVGRQPGKDADTSTCATDAGDVDSSADEAVKTTCEPTRMEKRIGVKRNGKTVISVSCAYDEAAVRFELLLKVEERGGLPGYEVYSVAKKVAAGMSAAMNDAKGRR